MFTAISTCFLYVVRLTIVEHCCQLFLVGFFLTLIPCRGDHLIFYMSSFMHERIVLKFVIATLFRIEEVGLALFFSILINILQFPV